MSGTLQKQRDGAVLRLRLDRPSLHNAFDATLIATLTDALAEAGTDASVRVVVVEGSGASFSAGADLNWMRGMASASEAENRVDALALARLMRSLDELPKPTIAAGQGAANASGFPTPAQFAATAWKHLSNPVYDNGPNDKGILIQLGHSLARVALGFLLACLVALPLGFVIGMSPLLARSLDPFIQILKPISPLAWMPLALYTIKDSSTSGIFVIFI